METWLPVDPFTSLEKEAFVVLFSLLQDFGDQLLTVLVAKFPDIEFLVRDSSVRGDVLEHDRSHTVVSREFLQCGPFQGFLVVLLSFVCRWSREFVHSWLPYSAARRATVRRPAIALPHYRRLHRWRSDFLHYSDHNSVSCWQCFGVDFRDAQSKQRPLLRKLWHFRTQESRSGTSSEVVCTSSFSILAFCNHVYTIYYGILNVNLPSTTLLHAETTCKIDNIASTVRDCNKLRTSRTPPCNDHGETAWCFVSFFRKSYHNLMKTSLLFRNQFQKLYYIVSIDDVPSSSSAELALDDRL